MLAKRKRLARDDEFTVDDEKMEKAVEYLKSRLKPEEVSHLVTMLKGEQAEAEVSEADKTPTEGSGPIPVKGTPKPDGSMASDSRGNGYSDRFPNASRIKVWL